MNRLLAFALSLCLPAMVHADGGVTVPLPDLTGFDDAQYEELLMALVVANVVASNCPGFEITDGEWTLITGSADRIAEMTGVMTSGYDEHFYGPAFAMLDQPETCAVEGPKVRGIINLMIDLGGSSTPVN